MGLGEMVNYTKFKAPPPKPEDSVNNYYSERFKKIVRAHEMVFQERPPNKNEDIQEIRAKISAHEFPETTTYRLHSLTKVKIPKGGLFEFPDGTLDTEHKIKHALIFQVEQQTHDPKLMQGQEPNRLSLVSGCLFSNGFYQAPIASFSFNKDGAIIGSTNVGHKNRYYIEFTERKCKELIAQYGLPVGQNGKLSLVAGNGSESGHDPTEQRLSVFNLDEFIKFDAEILMAANRGFPPSVATFLHKDDGSYGGVDEYLQFNKRREENLKKGELTSGINPDNAKYLEDNKMTVDEIVAMLRQQKEVAKQPQQQQAEQPTTKGKSNDRPKKKQSKTRSK